MSKKTVLVLNGISYVLMNEQLVERNGVRYKNSYWLEGAGYDTNDDGKIANITFECKIPENCKDIDLSSLNPDCLIKNANGKLELISEINEEAKIAA